jgi:signal transduction histidine kinase
VAAAVFGAKLLAALPRLGDSDADVDALFQDAFPDLLKASHSEFVGWLLDLPAAQLPAVEAAAAAVSAGDAVTRHAVWEADGYGGAPVSPPARAARYAVLWAHIPWRLRFQNVLNMDTAARTAALDAARAAAAPAVSHLLPHLCSDDAGADAPGAIVYAPIWVHADAGAAARNATATQRVMGATAHAFCTMGFHWSRVLQEALANRIAGVVVVLRPPPLPAGSGGAAQEAHTFRDADGAFVSVGNGDLHARLVPRALAARFGRSIAFGAGWSAVVYPTPALRGLYVTPAPRNAALLVGAVLLTCITLFLFYECVVRRRAARLNAALRANLGALTRAQGEIADGVRREAAADAKLLAEEAASGQREAFVAMVSHEIRTPLNAVSGAAALLAHSGAPLRGEQRELLDLLQAGASQVVLIVDDILLHGALMSGHFPVLQAPLALRGDVLEPALRMVRLQAAKTGRGGTALACAVDARVPRVLRGDASRLMQMLTNLLSNALKFTSQGAGGGNTTRGSSAAGIDAPAAAAGGGVVELRVDLTDAPLPLPPQEEEVEEEQGEREEEGDAATPALPPAPQRCLRFTVVDNGCGIDPAHLERIFEPFRQESETTVRQYGGTGLGLTARARLRAAATASDVLHACVICACARLHARCAACTAAAPAHGLMRCVRRVCA